MHSYAYLKSVNCNLSTQRHLTYVSEWKLTCSCSYSVVLFGKSCRSGQRKFTLDVTNDESFEIGGGNLLRNYGSVFYRCQQLWYDDEVRNFASTTTIEPSCSRPDVFCFGLWNAVQVHHSAHFFTRR